MMSILEYLNCDDAERKDDWEWHVSDNVFGALIEVLPKYPPRVELMSECPIWTDGEEILVANEWLCEMLASMIDRIVGDKAMHTGYYDPHEDAMDGIEDDHTGWYYIDFD